MPDIWESLLPKPRSVRRRVRVEDINARAVEGFALASVERSTPSYAPQALRACLTPRGPPCRRNWRYARLEVWQHRDHSRQLVPSSQGASGARVAQKQTNAVQGEENGMTKNCFVHYSRALEHRCDAAGAARGKPKTIFEGRRVAGSAVYGPAESSRYRPLATVGSITVPTYYPIWTPSRPDAGDDR